MVDNPASIAGNGVSAVAGNSVSAYSTFLSRPKFREVLDGLHKALLDEQQKRSTTTVAPGHLPTDVPVGSALDANVAPIHQAPPTFVERVYGPFAQAHESGNQREIEKTQGDLGKAVDRSFHEGAENLSSSEREAKIVAIAQQLRQSRPNDSAFAKVVTQRETNELAGAASAAIKDTYRRFDTKTAAVAIGDWTTGRSPRTVKLILDGLLRKDLNKPQDVTIADIARGIDGSSAEDARRMYGELNAAVGRALFTEGSEQTAANIARQLVDNSHFNYGPAVKASVADGDGAALSLHMANQLRQEGLSTEAHSLLLATRDGIRGLSKKSKTEYRKYMDALSPLTTEFAQWGDFMHAGGSRRVAEKFFRKNPAVAEKVVNAQATMDRLGGALMRSAYTIESEPQLLDDGRAKSSSNTMAGLAYTRVGDELKSEMLALTDSTEGRTALKISKEARSQFVLSLFRARNENSKEPKAQSGIRNFIKEVGKKALGSTAFQNAMKFASKNVSDISAISALGELNLPNPARIREFIDPRYRRFQTGLRLGFRVPSPASHLTGTDPSKWSLLSAFGNTSGVVLNAGGLFKEYDLVVSGKASAEDSVKLIYYAGGTAKETLEALSLAKARGWPGRGLVGDDVAKTVLAKAMRLGWSSERAWPRFDASLKNLGATIDAAEAASAAWEAISAWRNGDPAATAFIDAESATFYTQSAAGGFTMGMASLAKNGTELQKVGGAAGGSLALQGGAALYLLERLKHDRLSGDKSMKFLQYLGWRREFADALGQSSGGISPGPALSAMTRASGADPLQLKAYLERKVQEKMAELEKGDKDYKNHEAAIRDIAVKFVATKLYMLATDAARLRPDSAGAFPVSNHDLPWGLPGDEAPDSLRLLYARAKVYFPDFPGDQF